MGCQWRTPPHSTPFSNSRAVVEQPTLWVQSPTTPVILLSLTMLWCLVYFRSKVNHFGVLHERQLREQTIYIDEIINMPGVVFYRQWRGLAQFSSQPLAGLREPPHNQTCWMTDMSENRSMGQTLGTGGVLGVQHPNTMATTCHLCPASRDCPVRMLQINPSEPL